MLSSIWHDPQAEGKFSDNPLGRLLAWFHALMERVSARYERLLAWSLAHRKTVLLLAFASFFASFPLMKLVGTEFVPEPDLSELQVQFKTPVGASLELTDAEGAPGRGRAARVPGSESTPTPRSTPASCRGKTRSTSSCSWCRGRSASARRTTSPSRCASGSRASPASSCSRSAPSRPSPAASRCRYRILGQERKVLAELAEQAMAATREVRGAVDVESSDEAAKPQVVGGAQARARERPRHRRRPGGGDAAAAARRRSGRQLEAGPTTSTTTCRCACRAPTARAPRTCERVPLASTPDRRQRLAEDGQPARDRQHRARQRARSRSTARSSCARC